MAADDYDATINEAALNWNVDPRLLKAVMLQESQGNPAAVSKAGARGLMQIMPDTGRTLGMTDLHDPTQSIWAGAKYLAQALDAEKTPQDALRYYHGGPDWRKSYGPESRDYVPGVAKYYAALAPKEQSAAQAKPAETPKQPDDAGAQKVTDDEFLRSTGATTPATKSAEKPQKAPGPASDDEFLKATGAAPASSKPQETASAKSAEPSLSDIITSPEAQAADRPAGTALPSRQDVVNALQPAPNTTYGDLPWTWLAKDDKTGAIRFAMPNALRAPLLEMFGGGQEGGPGITTTVDPATGEMSTGLSPLANLLMGGGARPLRFGPRGAVPAPGTFNSDTTVTGVNPLDPAVAARAEGRAEFRDMQGQPPAATSQTGEYVPPPSPVSAPAGREAVPGKPTQATGAQLTPSYEAIYTPAEEAAYRATAEGKKLLENQIIGEVDNNEYIPGVTVNKAELEQSVNAAREMKELGIQSKEASEQAKIVAQQNSEARQTYSLNTEKNRGDIHKREQQREEDITRDSAAVFSPENVKGEVSMQPLIDHMNEVKNRPRNRENSALQSEFDGLIKRLTDKDGNARTMEPEQAWSLKQDIDRMTDKNATTGDDAQARNRRRVASDLNRVSDVLDTEIENMAPGYKDMLATYKEHSRAIREMEVLQGMTADLMKNSPHGTMSFAAIQRLMKKIVDYRSTGSQDLNPYKSISEETMQRLWNLRDDLRRSAGALDLARAAGSDTAQNILDVLKSWGKLGVKTAGHGAALHLFGPGGPIALQALEQVTAPARAARMERRAVGRMRQLLNPETPLRAPPGQENPLAPP